MSRYYVITEYGDVLFSDEGFSSIEQPLELAQKEVLAASGQFPLFICKTVKTVTRPKFEALVEDVG